MGIIQDYSIPFSENCKDHSASIGSWREVISYEAPQAIDVVVCTKSAKSTGVLE